MTGLLVGAAVAVLAGVLAAARARLRLVAVRGSSMRPTLADGQRVLVWVGRSPRVADVVVFAMPAHLADFGPDWMVKRVWAVPGDPVPADLRLVVPEPTVPPGQLLVRGDNPRSADSRTFGYVPLSSVLGVVRLPAPTRSGPDNRVRSRQPGVGSRGKQSGS